MFRQGLKVKYFHLYEGVPLPKIGDVVSLRFEFFRKDGSGPVTLETIILARFYDEGHGVIYLTTSDLTFREIKLTFNDHGGQIRFIMSVRSMDLYGKHEGEYPVPSTNFSYLSK